MRIALLTMAAPWQQMPLLGVYTRHMAHALNEIGHPTEVFTPTMSSPRFVERFVPKLKRFNDRPDHYEYDGVRFHSIKGYMPHQVYLRWKVSPRFPRLSARLIGATVTGGLIREVRAFRPDAVLVHDGVMLGPTGKKVARAAGVPFGVIEHDPIDMPPDSVLGRYYVETVREAKVIFSVGFPWYRYLRDTLGLQQARLASNGTIMATDEQLGTPRPEKWRGRKVVLCVGGYLERKGHALLIEAFAAANVPGTLLAIVGPPPEPIAALVRKLGVEDRVEFLPLMPQTEVLQHMAWSDLFALPSWWESFGLVYAEAMSAACPVLMTTDCGMAFNMTAGEHGWVIPPRDVPALTAALREALTTADLKAMGRACREHVLNRLTWKRNAQTLAAGLSGEPDPDAHRAR
ncbi:MAG: glycosyltransferase [Phycisphaerales bacterium]|nr:glycosyltransferase [Phycisphaerales bacterium]